jgi:hypothetical protein
MPFTTVPDKAAGDIFTEQMWDTYIRDNINYLGSERGIYVEQYGAVGDGTTNDKPAIYAARDACPVGGRVIFDGSKTYAISGNLVIDKAITLVLNGCTIKNTANDRTLTIQTTSGQVIIDGGGGTIDCNRAVITSTLPGVTAENFPGTLILRNIRVKSAAGIGINAYGTGILICENIEVTDCKSPAIARAADGIQIGTGAFTARLNNVWINENDGSGFRILSTNTSNYHDCGLIRVDRSSSEGVLLQGGKGRIAQIHCKDNRSFGVDIAANEWYIGTITEKYTGAANGGNYLDGSGPDTSGTAVRTTASHITIGSISGKAHGSYCLTIAAAGTNIQIGSVIGDQTGSGSDADPCVAIQGDATHCHIGSICAYGYTWGLTLGEEGSAYDCLIGTLEVAYAGYGAVQFGGSTRCSVGQVITRECVAAAANGIVQFTNGATNNTIGLILQYNTGTKPDYAVRFDATSANNIVHSAIIPWFNLDAVLDQNGNNSFAFVPTATAQAVIGCKISNSATPTINNITWTSLVADTEAFDTDTMHSTSTNTSRITIRRKGVYRICASAWFGSGAGTLRYARLYKNGVTQLSFVSAPANVIGGWMPHINCDAYLVAGDYIEVQSYQDSGGALATQLADFSAVRYPGPQ